MATTPTSDLRPSRHNVPGIAVRDRDPPIRDYFQKAGRAFSENRGMNANSVMRAPLETGLIRDHPCERLRLSGPGRMQAAMS